jgi:hypothetical protein
VINNFDTNQPQTNMDASSANKINVFAKPAVSSPSFASLDACCAGIPAPKVPGKPFSGFKPNPNFQNRPL